MKLIKDFKTKTHDYYSAERENNLAEITPTSVSQGNTINSNIAGKAVDKNLTTIAATHTDNGAVWLKLQFDKTHFIHKIIIYYIFYTDWYERSTLWCCETVANFKYCVDNHNNVDVSVYQGEVQQKSCGTLQLTYALEQSDQIYTFICNTEGDTVKLSKSTGHIAVCEVVVISSG